MTLNFTVASIASLAAILANVVVAAFVYANQPKNATYKLFLAMSISVSVWLAVMLATDAKELWPSYVLLARATIVLATMMNAIFFLFAVTFPEEKFGLNKRQQLAFFLLVATVMLISSSSLAFSGAEMVNGIPRPINGPLFPVFGMFQSLLNLGVIVAFVIKIRRAADKNRKKQLRLVLIGILAMFGLITGTIFLPVLFAGDTSFVGLVPFFVLIFTGLIAYAIFKGKLLNIKVVAAEMFSAGLIIVNAAQLLLSTSWGDFIWRAVIFVAVGAFAIMFIRSVHEEVKQREELSEMTVQLAEANTHLEELDNTKSEFISIASHQLRTPISVLKGYISLILEGAYGKVTPALKEKLEQMFIMNERLVHLINNLLSLSRIEKNKVEYVCSYFDAATLTREVVEELQFKAKEKKLELRFKSPTETLPKIYADPDKLREIIINLTDNAIKYTPKGWVEWTLRQGTASEGVVLTIGDSGVGMSEEESRSIFKKFYRASQEGQKREKGTGLGLFVCVRFAQGMGGRVWIERTAPREGTTFAVSLPTAPSADCEPKAEPVRPPVLTA